MKATEEQIRGRTAGSENFEEIDGRLSYEPFGGDETKRGTAHAAALALVGMGPDPRVRILNRRWTLIYADKGGFSLMAATQDVVYRLSSIRLPS